ncbi:MAG: spore germination protein [Firmicutes bacterium]|nr:spore germination protein [Bacillota bacterium]
MYHKPRRRLLRRLKREIAKIKMEFAREEFNSQSAGLAATLAANLDAIRRELNNSSDLIIRRFNLGGSYQDLGAIIYIDGLVDKNQVERSILRPLMLMKAPSSGRPDGDDRLADIELGLITVGEIKRECRLTQVIEAVLSGKTVLLIDGSQKALVIATPGWEKRSVNQPDSEVIVKGPRDGFVETLRTNTALLRRKLGDPRLALETLQVGTRTKTEICIAYLKDIADPKLIKEIKQRINRINTDGIFSAGALEEFLEDASLSFFATMGYTERPDVVCSKLLEGRAAVFIDGTPVVLTAPFLFIENFQSPDDYTFKLFFGSMIRWVRYTAFLISILLPAVYVALVSFHQEMIPTQLLITTAAAIEGTPFPVVIEALVMGLVFEILREAGIRLPRPIGQTVSIIGALVIGEATVSAGLVGAPLIIVVAFTAITSFVTPTLVQEGTLIRFALTILSGFLGAFGITIGLLAILIHMASLRSFGVPYLSPITPMNLRDLSQDVLIRAPWWAMFTRPKVIGGQNRARQDFYSQPGPTRDGQGEAADETLE